MDKEAKRLLGQNIKEARENRGLSQNDLSLMVGIGRPYLSDLERGNIKRNPSVDTIDKIVKGLGTTMEAVFRGL